MKNNKNCKTIKIRDLGLISYEEGMRIQEECLLLRQKNDIPDTLLLLEHLPVYTLGVSATESDILWDSKKCENYGIKIVRTSRGGKVTFHGPGQLVGYPVVRLDGRNRSVVKYITMLEDVLIAVLHTFDIQGNRDKRNRGVWVGNDKIAAIGVRISRGVAFHGFALNVNTDLSLYDGIVPCGTRNAGVTSIHKIIQKEMALDVVKRIVVEKFIEIFGYDKQI